MRREHGACRVGWPPVQYNLDHFRNHIACPANNDGITDAHILALDLVHVVQGRIADRYAGNSDRPETRNRCDCPRASNLEFDVLDKCQLLLGRKLVCDGPAWRATDETETGLLLETVDLVDDPVDLVGQTVTSRKDSGVIVEALVDT